ncbi:Late embryogenesis abundant protein [Cinnamomum micranthum f. kanehirae]|uniref:Late embryogenesis abundant protein n=1 Tax=Cinnamomum micranthum f. kanehirae TaxID=337451 RepID=A0A443NP32_9MAGN|nr:Late embryogenesis abundant protein [Cinnamomum micranthum f. kanehirae]
MNHKPPNSSGGRGGRTNLASCVVATIFLIFVAIVILIVFFTVFKPKEPKISVNAFHLPSYSTSNGTVNFTFSQFVSVRNPNRDSFSHYDSSLQLTYSGSQVGFMFIPAGKIDGGRTQYMSATFSVESFRFANAAPLAVSDGIRPPAPSMEIDSRMRVEGRVRILHFFTHHVETVAACRVAISVADGSVLGFRC